MTKRLPGYFASENGTSAAEFGLVLIPFVALVLAIIFGSFLVYTNMTLEDATETAARCYAVDTTDCNTAGAAQTWASKHYYGLVTATFTGVEGGCGPGSKTVTGSATFPLNVIVYNTSVQLKSSSCFP